MKLSRYEQEVVINLNADEDEATVYTSNPAWMRKMDKLHREFPEIICLMSWTEVSKTYVLPKNLIRIGKPRTLSEAQLRHLQFLGFDIPKGGFNILWEKFILRNAKP